jgi:hypothetical protein
MLLQILALNQKRQYQMRSSIILSTQQRPRYRFIESGEQVPRFNKIKNPTDRASTNPQNDERDPRCHQIKNVVWGSRLNLIKSGEWRPLDHQIRSYVNQSFHTNPPTVWYDSKIIL